MLYIVYAALPMREQTERRHFHAKTTCAKLYIYIGVGSRDLFIDEAHMALGIFLVFFPACCRLRFAAFFTDDRPA